MWYNLEMGKILKIYTIEDKEGEKILRRVSQEVSKNEISSKDFQLFLDDLVSTAKNVETDEGYSSAGLAAIQVGTDKRVFCFLKENSDEFEIMINPEIKIIGKEKIVEIEGCLSIPKFEGRVSRYKKIKVKYIDREGKTRKGVFKNQEAREIQHENDHLDGILFTDKLSD